MSNGSDTSSAKWSNVFYWGCGGSLLATCVVTLIEILATTHCEYAERIVRDTLPCILKDSSNSSKSNSNRSSTLVIVVDVVVVVVVVH